MWIKKTALRIRICFVFQWRVVFRSPKLTLEIVRGHLPPSLSAFIHTNTLLSLLECAETLEWWHLVTHSAWNAEKNNSVDKKELCHIFLSLSAFIHSIHTLQSALEHVETFEWWCYSSAWNAEKNSVDKKTAQSIKKSERKNRGNRKWFETSRLDLELVQRITTVTISLLSFRVNIKCMWWKRLFECNQSVLHVFWILEHYCVGRRISRMF